MRVPKYDSCSVTVASSGEINDVLRIGISDPDVAQVMLHSFMLSLPIDSRILRSTALKPPSLLVATNNDGRAGSGPTRNPEVQIVFILQSELAVSGAFEDPLRWGSAGLEHGNRKEGGRTRWDAASVFCHPLTDLARC